MPAGPSRRSLTDTRVFIDAENLFWHEQFYGNGEFDPHRLALLAEMATDADSPIGHRSYPEYNAVFASESTLEIVPKIVDHLVDWLNDMFDVREGRAYGYPANRGVRASRERFASKSKWRFVDVEQGEDVADRALLVDLEKAAGTGPESTIVVGSSDAKSYLEHGSNGPITEAIQIIEGVRRRRRLQHELIVVLGAQRQSPDARRWNRRAELGRVDVVYRLSEVVGAAIRSHHMSPEFRPRQHLSKDQPPQDWRGACSRWVSLTEPEAIQDLGRALGNPEAWAFKGRWRRFEDGLLWLKPEKRDRLLCLAAQFAERHRTWVGAQRQTADRRGGLATMPAASLHELQAMAEPVQ